MGTTVLAASWFDLGPSGFTGGAVFGGPSNRELIGEGFAQDALASGANPPVELPIATDVDDPVAGLVIVEYATIVNPANPISGTLPGRDGLILYTVRPGDNLSTIAANFGISLNTILWANESVREDLIQPDQELTILPVSGVLHVVTEGESISSIAARYGASPDQVISVNPRYSESSVLEVGAQLIVPGGRPQRSYSSSVDGSLPNLSGYFALPTTGWNWGKVHANNAVDVANACGTAIFSAAEGLVVDTGSPNGWNSGYGGYIKIEHPNGTASLYAHTQENLVSDGEYVQRGQLIAELGNTGNTHGPTGCHLHFEVHGAQNPLER